MDDLAFMEEIINEGGLGYDPEETQSQDDRDQGTQGQDPHDHLGQDTQGQESQDHDGVDIDDEPLFHDELSHQANAQKRWQSMRT